MPKPKLTEKEIKERKRLAEQKRRAKIRNDPVLREEYLRKDRERYLKLKAAGVIVPRSAMTAQQLRNLRKKNLLSAHAYYKRKKAMLHKKTNPNAIYVVEYPKTPKTEPNETTFELSEETSNDNSPLTKHNPSLESLESNWNNCDNLQIRSSTNCLATGSHTSLESAQLTPNVNKDSTLDPESPTSNSTMATKKLHDLQQKFLKYKQSKHAQLIALQKKLAEVVRERNLYKTKYEKLISEKKR